MTEQERKEIIDKYGYPPHMPCGECAAYSSYCDAEDGEDEMFMREVIYHCSNDCDYYKQICGGNNEPE